ncbi:MAG: hypothetical protein JST93_11670 [Acidobacteria bacterium]|nr:hypothetical protein [Acidobacteriota bacterium]
MAVFSAPLVTPLVSAQPESKLPPCCRRDGKHRCAMMAKAALPDDGTASLRSGGMKCPLYPAGKSVPAPIAGYPPPHFSIALHGAAEGGVGVILTVDCRRLFESCSASKRGPPALFS